mgnify:CR=1 FL=1
MSNKLLFQPLTLLSIMLLLAGCITTEVEIALNPDGSGTLAYTQHYDRATEEQRKELHERFQSPNVSQTITRASILEHYPEPHFKLIRFDQNEKKLRTEVEIQFNDINALLIPRDPSLSFGLDSLDFAVADETLTFSLERDASVGKQMATYEGPPGKESLSILNPATGEKISFSRELKPEAPATNWVGQLTLPGHTIIRRPHLQIFHPYPVVEAAACKIQNAAWKLSHFSSGNALDLKLNITLPPDNGTTLRWEKPAMLSGGFMPAGSHPAMKVQGKGEFKNGELEIKLPIPEHSVEKLSDLMVRIQATRASSPRRVSLGELKANSEYQVDDLTLKTGDLKNGVSYQAKGPVDQIKSTLIVSKRGNRFELDRSSWSSSGNSKSARYWKFLPPEGCTLELELYEELEPFYIDIRIPDIDLTQRAWKAEEKSTDEAVVDWKVQLKATNPELFAVVVPAVTESVFESSATYKAYFQGLENEQILPAIAAVVDYMLQHSPENGQMWIQNYPRDVLQKRDAFLAENQQQIVVQLLAIYKNAPSIHLPSMIANLRLQEIAQPIAFSELKAGNLDFAKPYLFSTDFAVGEVTLLCELIEAAPSWVEQLELLRVLEKAHAVTPAFAMKLFNDRTRSVHVRKEALEILLKFDDTDLTFAEKTALDSTDDQVYIAAPAARFLLKQDPFPSELCLRFLQRSKLRNDALNSLNAHLITVLRNKDTAEIERWKTQIQPFVPVIEDLSEQLDDYKARPAKELLETIEKLNAWVKE